MYRFAGNFLERWKVIFPQNISRQYLTATIDWNFVDYLALLTHARINRIQLFLMIKSWSISSTCSFIFKTYNCLDRIHSPVILAKIWPNLKLDATDSSDLRASFSSDQMSWQESSIVTNRIYRYDQFRVFSLHWVDRYIHNVAGFDKFVGANLTLHRWDNGFNGTAQEQSFTKQ